MTGEVSDGLAALNVVPTGSYGSLHTRGSLAQMVYSTQDEDDPEHVRWVTPGTQQDTLG